MREERTLALTLWKADSHRFSYDGYDQPQIIEAEPEARWERREMVVSYDPNPKDQPPERGAHAWFLKLKTMKKDLGGRYSLGAFNDELKRFADRYGLLGLCQETLSLPILPPRADLLACVAPDAMLDKDGRLRVIDPATEGKKRLEEFFCNRRGRSVKTSRKGRPFFHSESLVLPHELRFSTKGLTVFGRLSPPFESHRAPGLSWEGLRNLYGVYAVLDEDAEMGVSIISTREPLIYWDTELDCFLSPPCVAESFSGRLEGVTPHPVPAGDGKFRQGWRCPSLLKAMYAMLYVDAATDNELRKCQDPGCSEYFLVGKRDKARKYCRPPEGKKYSQCGSRVTSQRHRERREP